MPRPTSPPPPQPSLEETRAGVRLVYGLSAGFLAVYLLIASAYGYDARMVQYGRDDGQSWNIWRARTLDEAEVRAHPGGRVAWLIGSSVLRDSFDEAAINAALEERGSPWRIRKFGMPRGATGIAVGMLDELPVRPGDRVIHSVAMDNFRRRWLHYVGLPEDRVARLLSPGEMWAIDEYALQEKLEQAVGVPYDFFRYHEPYMNGLSAWFTALWWLEPPKKAKPKHYLRFRRTEEGDWLEDQRERGEEDRNFFPLEEVDMRPTQINVAGLATLRRAVSAAGAELHLLDIPYRQEYQRDFQEAAVAETWETWRASQPELSYFPQLPEDHYYDLRHPNGAGRAILSAYFVDWMAETPRGQPTPLSRPTEEP